LDPVRRRRTGDQVQSGLHQEQGAADHQRNSAELAESFRFHAETLLETAPITKRASALSPVWRSPPAALCGNPARCCRNANPRCGSVSADAIEPSPAWLDPCHNAL